MDSSQRFLGGSIHSWIQSIGIVAAGILAIYTFVYKDIFLPKSAPVNLTLSLQLQKVKWEGSGSAKENSLIPIEMQISASNPSSRSVYFMPNIWLAYGRRISSQKTDNFEAGADAVLGSDDNYEERYAVEETPSLVGLGRIFSDTSLKPGEKISRTIIFHVPPNAFDLVEVYTYIPTTARTGTLELQWRLNAKKTGVDPLLYRVDTHGHRSPLKPDANGGYADSEKKDELQAAHANAELSLD